ncbi:hypothetical protein J0383_22585 [Flavobacterium endoglycinae]|uniref:Uncharacterized protein n=1 Tax=Flavobacterium endoglycinae TaxID=2816357 RepID=A0ABX7QEJ7_9FLAO|nr:hypothetical protein [Flavobacterium endoglycinae]QSW89011.1 hypothetical protein J0383_22585 [Flavobacterium endoglycinae]
MKTQKPILVFVMTLPFFNFFKDEIAKKWPNHSIYFLVNPPISILYEFAYPKNINVSFPYITDTEWKTCGEDIGYVWYLKNNKVIKTRYSTVEILKSAETFSYIGSLGSSDAVAFQTLILLTFGKFKNPYLFYHPENFIDEDIAFSLNNPLTTNDENFQKQLNRGIAKCYFEYNFNFNSCVLFKPILKQVGLADSNFVFTKYVLQLFFALEYCSNFTTKDLVTMMENWSGTGLYLNCAIGRPHSYHYIFMHLVNNKLIEYNGIYEVDEYTGKRYKQYNL